jgi:hypothetical protein
MTKDSVVSGFVGRIFAHSTLRTINLKPVAIRKIIMKVTLKRSTSFAKFFTL